jgi:hypothetical protein
MSGRGDDREALYGEDPAAAEKAGMDEYLGRIREFNERRRKQALAEHEANVVADLQATKYWPATEDPEDEVPEYHDEGLHEEELPWARGLYEKLDAAVREGISIFSESSAALNKPIPREIWSKLHGIGTPPSDDGYDSLRAIYAMALEQAQGGKGKERHANGQPFDQQPICQGGRRFGAGCLIYQAWKKAHETPVLMTMDNGTERAIRELLGVINYAAAAIIVLQEGK